MVGLVFGAGVVGGALALARNAVPYHSDQLAAVATAALLIGGILWFGRNLPGIGFEVPLGWLRLGDLRYGFIFGALLGAGWVTRVPSVGFYTVNAWMLLSGHPLACLFSFLAFGLGKSVPACIALASTLTTDKNFTWSLGRYKAAIPAMMAIESAFLALGATSLIV
jgi:hypothetical protein